MMGLGGDPEDPDDLYLVPLSNIKHVGLYPSFLERYQVTSFPIEYGGRGLIF